jgi:hypothetical protein
MDTGKPSVLGWDTARKEDETVTKNLLCDFINESLKDRKAPHNRKFI